MSAKSWHIEEGKPYPMGATLTSKGANFTLFSINAEKVELCLFDKDKETRLEMPSRRGSVFYGFVPDVKAGQRYGFRVYGRENAEYGSCFNPNKLLIDPYSKKIDGKPSYRNAEEMAWFRPPLRRKASWSDAADLIGPKIAVRKYRGAKPLFMKPMSKG